VFPLTYTNLFEYADRAGRIRDKLARFYSAAELISNARSWSRESVLPYQSEGWNEKAVAAAQPSSFRVGRSALLEGGALLDCFQKPGINQVATIGLSVVEDLFRHRNLSLNYEHTIGVESCLAAVGLGNQEFRDHRLRESLRLARNLPNLVLSLTLASALRELGFSARRWNYRTVLDFLTKEYWPVRAMYEKLLTQALRAVFRDGKCDEWLRDVIDL
jgi:hypothetical protein